MVTIEILAGIGLSLALYYFLAKSEDLEWSRKNKRFEDWRKNPEFKDLKWDSNKQQWKQ